MRRKMMIAAMLLFVPVQSGFAAPVEKRGVQAGETAAAMDFLGALGRQDFETAGRFLDEEAVLDLPFAGKGLRLEGREAILQFFRKSMAKSVGSIHYELERAYPSAEAGALVLEISTLGRTSAGVEYRNRLVTIFEFRQGKIRLFREYFNPVPLGGS